MSAIVEPKRKVTPPPDDPWYYGWRDVQRILPDGTVKFVKIPLTLEDALHPEEGDFVVESSLHDRLRSYLAIVFRNRTKHDPHALVLANTVVYWDNPKLRHHVPDVCVIFGTKTLKIDWQSFDVREEGTRPHAIVEIVSLNTRVNDIETKLVQYHMARVPFYFIFDKSHEDDPWTLLGYQWTPIGYLPLHADPAGRMWLDTLGIWLAAEGKNIVCYDGETNERFEDPVDNIDLLKEAKVELHDANARAESEKQRAENEKQRAENEKQRAENEKQRAENSEAKMKELEAELARLRGQQLEYKLFKDEEHKRGTIMSAIVDPKRKVTPPPPDDPWYYGWRDVYRTLPDGTRKHEQIPLTLEDALHPQQGDYIVESDVHDLLRTYLASVFRYCVADDPHALVLSDTGVYWDHPALDHHAPDVCVIFGVKKKKPIWHSFSVQEEGVWPHAIVEIVSLNTRKNDVKTKLVEYHMAEVPYYFIFDKEHEEDPWTLRGYEWTPTGYLALNADPAGRIRLDAPDLWLAAEGQNIVCYDGNTNKRIGNYDEHTQRMNKAEGSLDDAETKSVAEKRRADTEKRRADTEKQRADTEKQRADTEKQARETAEAKLKELEAELARLRGL